MSIYKLYNALRKAFCTLTTETFKSDFFYAMNKSIVTEHAWCVSACGDGVVLGNIIPSHVLNRYTKIVSSTLAWHAITNKLAILEQRNSLLYI